MDATGSESSNPEEAGDIPGLEKECYGYLGSNSVDNSNSDVDGDSDCSDLLSSGGPMTPLPRMRQQAETPEKQCLLDSDERSCLSYGSSNSEQSHYVKRWPSPEVYCNEAECF